jgi:hypothetical protein
LKKCAYYSCRRENVLPSYSPSFLFQTSHIVGIVTCCRMQDCTIPDVAQSLLYCALPSTNLSNLFAEENSDQTRQGLAAASLRSMDGNLSANLYLGFTLDGWTKYENISESVPQIALRYVIPRLIFNHDNQEYDPDLNESLVITVSYVTVTFNEARVLLRSSVY